VRVELFVKGRPVLTTEDIAYKLEKTPSAVRSWIRRQEIKPAGYVTKNVPVYYPADLGIEES
jgi:uncharacterized protein YjcR